MKRNILKRRIFGFMLVFAGLFFLGCDTGTAGDTGATGGDAAPGDNGADNKTPLSYPHPRLLLLKGEEERLKQNIDLDGTWQKVHNAIIAECDNILPTTPIDRHMEGITMLPTVRVAVKRIFYLSYAYRMTKDRQYLDRAVKEMLAIAAFSDWNPEQYLDTAETTFCMAIGYDWLYDDLSSADRNTIKTAILKKGIEPSFDTKHNWFLTAYTNWNQVCNAGASFGAWAIYEDMPEYAESIVERAKGSIVIPMNACGPDGNYPEGYGYWEFGTSYNVMFLSELEKLYGTDYGLSTADGFLKSPYWQQNMIAPSKTAYNYSDNGMGSILSPSMFWFADKLRDPSLLWNEKRYLEEPNRYLVSDRLLPTLLIWGSHTRLDGIPPPGELLYAGRGMTPVVLMRTSWNDADALYVGIKGGKASTNHGHMDAGSFVMEADGIRWAGDPGMENYIAVQDHVDLWNMRQDSTRWDLFRYNNFAHNTLTVDGAYHAVNGSAELVSCSDSGDFTHAVFDLSPVFEGQLARSGRGIAIVDKAYVVVVDELETLDKVTNLRWSMFTLASIAGMEGARATLTKGNRTLTLRVVEPEDAVLRQWPADTLASYESSNPGAAIIGFEALIPANAAARFVVELIPDSGGAAERPIPPLSEW
jgi:hypothetical protein